MRILSLILICVGLTARSQQLYEMPKGVQSRVSSFENLNGVKGAGGKTNKTAKGNAFEWIKPGESKALLDVKAQGIIQRIWLTINQSPLLLRSMRLQMFWDGSSKAAVDAPLGDFFVYNLGKGVAFQSSLFSSGEGRSFNCYIPMPFRKQARVVLTNDGTEPCRLFYDVDYIITTEPMKDAMYFHAYWTRQLSGKIGDDFEVLPKISGKGRFLGMSVGVNSDSAYDKTWWGEGEVKMYVDGDTQYPTINGTGTEDYIGSAWGLGTFTNMYQGCTIADEKKRQYNFYRWHIPDAIYFNSDIRVALQQIGGGDKQLLKELQAKGVKLKPISIDNPNGFVRLFEMKDIPNLADANFPDGWVNFYRVDDYSAVSYFYLDKPTSTLSSLPSIAIRTANVK